MNNAVGFRSVLMIVITIVPSFPRTGPPLLWQRDIGAGFAGPAVSAGKLVLFHRVNNRPSASLGATVSLSNGRETVEAMDAVSGKTLWTSTSDEASYSAPVMAEIEGQRTAVFFTRTGLVALDPANGTVRYQYRWRARMAASVNAASPIVVKDQIFLSASYGTGAVLLQVANNAVKPVWSGDESLSNHYSTSVDKDGYLYGFEGRQEFGQTRAGVTYFALAR